MVFLLVNEISQKSVYTASAGTLCNPSNNSEHPVKLTFMEEVKANVNNNNKNQITIDYSYYRSKSQLGAFNVKVELHQLSLHNTFYTITICF